MYISVRLERTSLCARSPWVVGKGTIQSSQVLPVSFLPRMLWCMSVCPHPSPLRKVNGTVAAVVDRGTTGRDVGGNLSGRWRCHEVSDRSWRGKTRGRLLSPPSPFYKQVPFKFTLFTSCPHQSPAPGAWFPPCRYGCPPRKQVWYWRRGFARPHRRCLRSPVWPGCGWTRLSEDPTTSPYRHRSWWWQNSCWTASMLLHSGACGDLRAR